MIHKLKQGGVMLEAELEHTLIRVWYGKVNLTASHQELPESHMGGYSQQNEAWILPSPIDAINLFRQLQELIDNGSLRFELPEPALS